MIDIKLRYNTQCEDNHTFWRILIDGKEYTCSNVIFEIPTQTTKDIVWDSIRGKQVEKHHMSCLAHEVLWDGDVVTIR
jgi:hypothetical protein